jgi:hypothetical protein
LFIGRLSEIGGGVRGEEREGRREGREVNEVKRKKIMKK